MKLTGIQILSITTLCLLSCKPEDIILHGEISGEIIEAGTAEPIGAASVTLNQLNYSTTSGSDGKYLIKNIIPGNYMIRATKLGYASSNKNVTVSSAETEELDLPLYRTAIPDLSESYLDFGLDSIQMSFRISNTGTGNLIYFITPSQGWITVNNTSGDVITNEIDTITVTINKTDLNDSIYKETINVAFFVKNDDIPDKIIDVYLNGVMDHDTNYYSVVDIGTQTWMAENLNVGREILVNLNQTDDGVIEKYHLHNLVEYNNNYGGLYQWDEMMQYKPSDNGIIGTTQGICPVGWHIPTSNEWGTLIHYLGGGFVAGGKLKSKATPPWLAPNLGATNESGFSGLPGGIRHENGKFEDYESYGHWWSSTELVVPNDVAEGLILSWDYIGTECCDYKPHGCSVRCVQNQDNQ